MVLWGERFTSGKDDVEIEFAEAPQAVDIYDIIEGTEPMQSLNSTKSIRVTLTDHPVILKIKT